MVRFGEGELAREMFYVAKKSMKTWDINADNIVILKLVKTKLILMVLLCYKNIIGNIRTVRHKNRT